jgi:mitosis inhibitor protein kinase SWE1
MFDEEDESQFMPPTPVMGGEVPLPPQPLFPAPTKTSHPPSAIATSSRQPLFGPGSQTESRIPRLTASQPTRARAGTTVDADRPALGGKKAISLDRIPSTPSEDEPFGVPVSGIGKKARSGSSLGGPGAPSSSQRAHKRINSGDYLSSSASNSSISRSFGQKYGLALSLSPSLKLPDFSNSNSSLSSLSTSNLTPPASSFSPAEPPIFEDVKPLQEVFESAKSTVGRKFKPRDSGVSMGDEEDIHTKPKSAPPPSVLRVNTRPRRPAMLKRTSSMGNDRHELETPLDGPSPSAMWPTSGAFQFLGESEAKLGIGRSSVKEDKSFMPDTPVKKQPQAYNGPRQSRIGHSSSQPTLGSDAFDSSSSPSSSVSTSRILNESDATNLPSAPRRPSFIPPESTKKPSTSSVPHLTLTTTSSPDTPTAMDTDQSSPTVRLGGKPDSLGSAAAIPSRVGLLRRTSSGAGSSDGSEDDGTPTKGGGDKALLVGKLHSAFTLPLSVSMYRKLY